MNNFRKLSLLSAIAAGLALSGCGGSSSSSSTDGDTTEQQGTEVTGTVSAPGGQVAQFEPASPLQLAAEFFFPPAAAAIIGLDPVEGAEVQLIRVDNDGNQIGDVLARTTTSITGDYTLTVPAGTSLAGNLIVRITGTNNNQLRAQVVDQEVDIDPISEFVLQKFIDRGADLESLETDKVVKLRGQADEFDLAAEADLATMFARLDEQLGDFIEGQVDVISTPDGDVTQIAGDFRSSAINLGLHDSDGQGYGSFATDLYSDNFRFADNGDGEVGVTLTSGPSAYAYLGGNDIANSMVEYYPELADNEVESFTATYSSNGVLTISGEFEEDIDGDFGFRFPPTTYRLQQNLGGNLFVLMAPEAVVRYRTVDTNDDGEKDAVDPNQKDGDEVMRSLEFFARLPDNATASDLSGAFGLVSLGTYLEQGSAIRIESEVSTATFDGSGSLDVVGGDLIEIAKESSGAPSSLQTVATDEPNLSITLDADGTISNIDGEEAAGFVNDTFDLVVIPNFDGANTGTGDFAETQHTLMVKLPEGSAPALSDRTYRAMLMTVTFDSGGDIALNNTGFDTTVTFDSETAATISGHQASIVKGGGLAGEVGVETSTLEDTLAVSGDGQGALTLTASDDEGGVTTLDGFMNADGSLALLRTSYDPDGDGPAGFNELGLMVLVELP